MSPWTTIGWSSPTRPAPTATIASSTELATVTESATSRTSNGGRSAAEPPKAFCTSNTSMAGPKSSSPNVATRSIPGDRASARDDQGRRRREGDLRVEVVADHHPVDADPLQHVAQVRRAGPGLEVDLERREHPDRRRGRERHLGAGHPAGVAEHLHRLLHASSPRSGCRTRSRAPPRPRRRSRSRRGSRPPGSSTSGIRSQPGVRRCAASAGHAMPTRPSVTAPTQDAGTDPAQPGRQGAARPGRARRTSSSTRTPRPTHTATRRIGSALATLRSGARAPSSRSRNGALSGPSSGATCAIDEAGQAEGDAQQQRDAVDARGSAPGRPRRGRPAPRRPAPPTGSNETSYPAGHQRSPLTTTRLTQLLAPRSAEANPEVSVVVRASST